LKMLNIFHKIFNCKSHNFSSIDKGVKIIIKKEKFFLSVKN
jgi:hypothetical protein